MRKEGTDRRRAISEEQQKAEVIMCRKKLVEKGKDKGTHCTIKAGAAAHYFCESMSTCWRLPFHFWCPPWAELSPCQRPWWWSLWWRSRWLQTLSCLLRLRCQSCWRKSCPMPLVELSSPHTHSIHMLQREWEEIFCFTMDVCRGQLITISERYHSSC